MKASAVWRLILWLGLGLAACRPGVDISQPPEIRYGEDVCERCNMIIGDARYAAALWDGAGEAHRFDDIGGMLAYARDTQTDVAAFWVHDVTTEAWLVAERAYYVVDSGHQTPMGFGIVACAHETTAVALAATKEGAVVLDFATLLAQVESRQLPLDPAARAHSGHDGHPSHGQGGGDGGAAGGGGHQ